MALDLQSFVERCYHVRYGEEVVCREYKNNQIKMPVHLSLGEELWCALLAEACPGARYFGTYRSHGLFLALSKDPEPFFREMLSLPSSPSKGRAGSMHLFLPEKGLVWTSAVVGSTISLAVGDALANAMQGNLQGLSVCHFGDGAMTAGTFWESLNFSKLKKLNILFVVADNGLAIHNQSHSGFDLDRLAKAFDLPIFEDSEGRAWSTEAGYSQFTKFLSQPGPKVFRYRYHRMKQHVGVVEDYDLGYRHRPEDPFQSDSLKSVSQTFDQWLGLEHHQELKLKIQKACDQSYESLLKELPC
ncbi:MAG: hypothetical protein CL675_01990 [Bdellovibrionaceae bacterium]|nr:hypothetical protein [Pseudobdellovibrionaceae bacterium]